MLNKGSRHLVLQFLKATKPDWHTGKQLKNDWQLLVIKAQKSDIYAEFGPCCFWSGTYYTFFQPIRSKSLWCNALILNFPWRYPSPSHIFALYYVTLFWYTRLHTEGESPQLSWRVYSLNCSCFFLWWHLWSETIYSVWRDSEALRFW